MSETLSTPPLLEVKNLRIELKTRDGQAPVIDDVSFTLDAGETLGIVGESGCGKSMTALAIMGLLPEKISTVAAGSIRFEGEELTTASAARLREIRGNEISMIFQEPMTSLNPLFTVGEQIAEVLRAHQALSKRAAWDRAIELLDLVQIPNPKERVGAYPFQMSGGQRQRVMIAIALACEPRMLIADEPTTALDVTVQAQILELLAELRQKTGTAIMMITHDMGVVANMAERMMVMYAGRKIEEGPVDAVIDRPRHPYTQGLISCVPHLTEVLTVDRPELTEVGGIVPALSSFGQARCLFAPRCHAATDLCCTQRPSERAFNDDHLVTCHHAVLDGAEAL